MFCPVTDVLARYRPLPITGRALQNYSHKTLTLPIQVTAIDRAELNAELMMDEKVSFVQGDAFSFSPLDKGGPGTCVDWMVSGE